MKILITSGATREPIDAVRFISNLSTGATGATLADALQRRGHTVTLLHGLTAARPARSVRLEEFSSAADLCSRLRRHLAPGRFDAVIMAAAVADYRPRRVHAGKISSTAANLTLKLARNAKLLPRLKRLSPKPLCVVGFKLTAGASAAARVRAVSAQFAAGGVDLVVHNDLSEIRSGRHPFRLHGKSGDPGIPLRGVTGLAAALHRALIATPAVAKGSTR